MDFSGGFVRPTFLCAAFMTTYLTLQMIAFVMDNASNNDTMVTVFEARCRRLGIRFSASQSRLRCAPHTCHLATLKVDPGYSDFWPCINADFF